MVTVCTPKSITNLPMVLLFRVHGHLVNNSAEEKMLLEWCTVPSGCYLNNIDLYLSGVRLRVIVF